MQDRNTRDKSLSGVCKSVQKPKTASRMTPERRRENAWIQQVERTKGDYALPDTFDNYFKAMASMAIQ